MKTRFIAPRLALAAALAFASLQSPVPAAAQDKAVAAFPDPVVAQGRGFEIKRSVLDDFVVNYKTTLAEQKQRIPDSELPGVTSNILQHLILNKILFQKATDDEKNRVTADVAKTIDDYRKSRPSESIFQAEIKASGTTLDVITTRTVEEQLGKVVLVRELVSSNAVSDEAIKKYYDANPDLFVIPERARIAQILIATRDQATGEPLPAAQKQAKEKLAREIKAKADQGEDFAKLVRQYSDDAASTNNGGEYPPIARGSMSPVFEAIEAAAFSLKTNQVSDPVETDYGYHIVKLLEKIPPSTVDLDKVSPKIKARLIEAEVNKQLPAYAAKLESEYEVKVFDADAATAPATVPAPVK